MWKNVCAALLFFWERGRNEGSGNRPNVHRGFVILARSPGFVFQSQDAGQELQFFISFTVQ